MASAASTGPPGQGGEELSEDAASPSSTENESGSEGGSPNSEDAGAVKALLTELVPSSPEILRATSAAVPLERFGLLLRQVAGGAVARGDSRDQYSRSFNTTHFDEFWSHSWHGPGWEKVLTLLIFYNAPPAVAVSSAAAFAGASLQFWAPSSRPEVAALMSFCPAFLGFFLTLTLWRSGRRVFLDSICICQADKSLKKQGIMSLGGFLRHSKSMLILWDPSYCGRLWCVFEQAAFYFLQTQDPSKNVYVRPTCQVSCALIVMLCVCLRVIGSLSVSSMMGLSAVVQASSMFVLMLVMAPALRRIARGVADLSETIGSFTMDRAKCFCCSHDHCHPITGEELACDRVLVEASVQEWFGSIEHFVDFVRTDLNRRFVAQCNNPYRIAVLWTVPHLWWKLGKAAHLLSTGRAQLALKCACMGLLMVFLAWPCLLELFFLLATALRARSAGGLADAGRNALLASVMFAFQEGLWLAAHKTEHARLTWPLLCSAGAGLSALTALTYGRRVFH